MKKVLISIYRMLVIFGINPIQTIHSIKGISYYLNDLRQLKRQHAASFADFPLGKVYPCLTDRFSQGGTASGHYFHQDLLIARRIFINKPDTHVDVGSRVDGFVAHVASFRAIEVIDIRPIGNKIPNITFKQADMMSPISAELVEYCDSLSCLHALEHFGLGRYGDPVNYEGHISGLDNLYKILQKNGKLYFSVPIGPQRIEFNAHRVFSVNYLLEYFKDKYIIDQFSFVDDFGNLHENVALTAGGAGNNFGCQLGCGIFELTKL